MSIRNKLLLFFIIQHFFFLVVALVTFEFILRPHNLQTEQTYAMEKISQIKNVFASEMNHLNITNTDWSAWDDTYAFVKERNQDYIDSNFPQDLLDDLNLNRIEIFDISGKSIYVRKNADLDMSSLMQDTQRLKEEFFSFALKDQNTKKSGFISLGDTVAFVSICPILQGDRKGPSVGVMMMIRAVDADIIENIRKSTHANVSLIKAERSPLYQNNKDKEFFSQILDANRLHAYGYLSGLSQEAAIIIKAELKREFSIQSEKLILSLFIFASILGLISLIASLSLMRKGISQPLSTLVSHISTIRNSENYVKCELDDREDEIGLMAKEFNLLLEKLNKTNEALLKVARIDTLTALPNRLDMEEKFQRIKDLSVREGMEFSILILDIDYFKNYNDSYGHVKGDEVLALIGQEIKRSSMRPGDYFARYGGEEFIGLLENTDKEGSITVAQRILKNIEDLHIEHKSSLLEKKIISLSIGCLSVVAKPGDTREFLINMADEALYKVKEEGRNGYRVYE